MKNLTSRIVILNYNGRQLLEQCLPSIMEAARQAKHPTQVTVLDNLSTDDGLQYVREAFPEAVIEIAKENRFLCSFTDYLRKIDEDVAILLNNDIRVDTNFVDPMMDLFDQKSNLFLVAPKVMDFEGSKVEAGPSRSGVRFGLFWCDARYPGYENDVDKIAPTVSSGFGAFSREKYLKYGGYRDWYLPGIMEDVDLCYRAKKDGCELLYQPGSVVYHIGQATFKVKFGSEGVAVIAHRNNFIFMWKNLRGLKFWIPHLFFLPLRLLFAALKGNLALTKGFLQALGKRT